jgi:hypothetical protein
MKELKEFPGYFVTEDGKVYSAWKRKNIKNEKGIIIDVKHYIEYNNLKKLKLCSDTNGYLRVTLSLDKKQYTKTVHRLIAKSYIPNPNNLPVVNHINEIKTDNRAENLEWTTHQQNCEHSNCKYVYTIVNIKTKSTFKIRNLNVWCKQNNLHESHLRGTYGKNTQHKGFKVIKKESISTLPSLSAEIAPSADIIFIYDKDSSNKNEKSNKEGQE